MIDCAECGFVGGYHKRGCKSDLWADMKRSTTEDYPSLDLASALRDAAEAADAQLARDIEAARGVKPHASDCAVYNEPAYPAGPCDCGAESALQRQEGGDHYKGRAIQPIEYIHANGLGFIEGSIVKYITRWRDKGGKGDLEKIKHYVDLLIELEQRK